MAWPKWKKRLAWCLAIPGGLALVGWVGMNVAEARLDDAILQEEADLEAMGLRVKPLTPEDDASPLYRAALDSSDQAPESLLQNLEKAEAKSAYLSVDNERSEYPVATLTPLPSVRPFQRLSQLTYAFARQGRYDLAVRAQRCMDRLGEQVTISNYGGFSGTLFVGSPIYLTDQIPPDPKSRKVLREYFESYDESRAARSDVSRAILSARRCLTESPPTSRFPGYVITGSGKAYVSFTYTTRGYAATPTAVPKRAWWDKFVAKHPLWRKMADLAVLRAGRLLALESLNDPYSTRHSTLSDKLSEVHDLAASWAKARQVNLMLFRVAGPALDVRRRSALVALDLAQQVGIVKSPAPTWSKKWTLIPGTSKPVRPSIKGDKVVFDNKAWPSVGLLRR